MGTRWRSGFRRGPEPPLRDLPLIGWGGADLE